MSKKHNGYKKQSNVLKPIGRIPDEQWKYLKPIIDRIDAEEETRDPKDNSIHCYVGNGVSMDFLKMILPSDVTFKFVG